MKLLFKSLFNYDELRATVLAYFIIVIKGITFLAYELKDGDVTFYLQNIGTIPNHNPLTFGILNVVYFFVKDKAFAFAIVELVSYIALYLVVLISLNIVFGKEKYYYLSFFILIYLPESIFYGSPLKEVLGLVLFFIFFCYFHKHKDGIRQKLPFVCVFLFLSFMTHIVSFMLCLVLLLSYFLLKNRKVAMGITGFAFVFTLIFSLGRDFFRDTYFFSFRKLAFIFDVNVDTIANNIFLVGLKPIYVMFLLVYILFVVGAVFYYKKIDYVDVFVFIISTYFIFGAADWDYFARFMSVIPFVLVFGLSSVVTKIYVKKNGEEAT